MSLSHGGRTIISSANMGTPGQGGFVWLHCLIEGEYRVFKVNAGLNDVIGSLKKAIQSERALSILKDVDPHTLELWKVSAIDESLCWLTLPHYNRSTLISAFTGIL